MKVIANLHDVMRQTLASGRESRREITLKPKSVGDRSCIDASGAIPLTLQDFLPTLHNSLTLPPGLNIELGVEANEVWPVSISDVEVEEEGEVGELTDQSLGFAQTHAEHEVRTSVRVEVSNQAIDAADFDLLTFVQRKFELAQAKYLAAHIYSTAQWDDNAGPFSVNHADQWSIPSGDLYKSIMAQMIELEQAGFDTKDAVIVVDFDMEKRLKYTHIVEGEGRMMIEDGLCCGYRYIANKYFNTRLTADGKLVRRMADAIGIGIFNWFNIAQHGEARLTIDGVSEEVASRDVTALTLNTAWSFTDLSQRINGKNKMQAFHTLVMQRGYLADVDGLVFRTSDGLLLTVGMRRFNLLLADSNKRIFQTSDGKKLAVTVK